jgi:hypothetical protein
MAKVFYVYLLHESPIVEPFYCKIGYSCDPLRRLDQLQAGNPRSLRSWDDERRPTEPFGLRISTREHARALEQLIIDQLEGMGMRLRRDYDYKNNCAAAREWFEGMHPKDLWIEMVKIYFYYLALNKDAEIA